MRQYNEYEEEEKLSFARKAGKWFSENPEGRTFTIDDIDNGEYFAVKWGAGSDCVLVFKIHEYDEIILYPHFIERS